MPGIVRTRKTERPNLRPFLNVVPVNKVFALLQTHARMIANKNG